MLKWEGRKEQELVQAVLGILLCFGIRLEAGIFRREGIIFLVELASESIVSFIRMPT